MSLTLIGWLLIAWAFFLSVGVVAWFNVQTGFMVAGTILYIIDELRK
jgi:hypothetical protein